MWVRCVLTLLMFALATAYRLQGEQEATGGEPMGWQRWWCQLLEQTRDLVISVVEDNYNIFHIIEHSLLRGVKLKGVLATISAHREILLNCWLEGHG